MDSNRPLFVGIAGPSSSGKTTLLKHLLEVLGPKLCSHFDLDGYHIHNREERYLLKEYPDDLAANDFDKLKHDLTTLRNGSNVAIPTYNHENGIFGPSNMINICPVIFVEGLHAARLNSIFNSSLIDISIYIDTDPDVRKSWKVKRDVTDRSYTFESAINVIEARSNVEAQQVIIQKNYADIILSTRNKLTLEHIVYTTININDILNKFFMNNGIESIFTKSEFSNYCLFRNFSFLKDNLCFIHDLSITSACEHFLLDYYDNNSFGDAIKKIILIILVIASIHHNY